MKYQNPPQFTVIRDTREQNGYEFSAFDYCDGMVEQKLDTGDYTILGLENKVCIERKGCVEELAINLGQKKYAFLREIERMKDFPHKFLVLEFSAEDLIRFPDESRIPVKNKSALKITGKYMMKCLAEFALYDNLHILFCGDRTSAFLVTTSILKRINEKYTIGRKS